MESTTTPPPPPPPPGQEPYTTPAPQKAGGGMRALAVLLAIILAFGAAVIIAVMVDLGGRPRCNDLAALVQAKPNANGKIECFDVTSTQRIISLGLGWIGGVLGGLAALFALAFAITGRRGRLLLLATAGAVIFSGLSILIGSL